jgi:hypothetical protein
MTHFQKNMSVLKEVFELVMQSIKKYGVRVLRIQLDTSDYDQKEGGLRTIKITIDLFKKFKM